MSRVIDTSSFIETKEMDVSGVPEGYDGFLLSSLFKDNAELVEGFPIKGSSSFNLIDSDNDGKLEIISRLDKFSVVSYEIN